MSNCEHLYQPIKNIPAHLSGGPTECCRKCGNLKIPTSRSVGKSTDIGSVDYGVLVDERIRSLEALVALREEDIELAHTAMDNWNIPRVNSTGAVYPLVGRVRTALERLPGPLNAVGGFGDIHIGVDWGSNKDNSALMIRCAIGHAFVVKSAEGQTMQKEGICPTCIKEIENEDNDQS